MFTESNSDFSLAEREVLNEAVRILMADGVEESNACDIVNNRWNPGATVQDLI